MEIIALSLLNAFILIFCALSQYLAFKERGELLDRIMAKSLPEYKDNQKLEENDFSDGQEKLVDIMDARALIEEKE